MKRPNAFKSAGALTAAALVLMTVSVRASTGPQREQVLLSLSRVTTQSPARTGVNVATLTPSSDVQPRPIADVVVPRGARSVVLDLVLPGQPFPAGYAATLNRADGTVLGPFYSLSITTNPDGSSIIHSDVVGRWLVEGEYRLRLSGVRPDGRYEAIADYAFRVPPIEADRRVLAALNERHDELVRECRTIIDGRYPFAPDGRVDVPVEDFGRLFGFGGLFETFFASEIEFLADTSTQPWTWRRDSTGTRVDPGFSIAPFEMAERISQAFFQSGGRTPQWRVSATPILPNTSTSRFTLAVDGRRLVDYFLPEGRINGGITRSVTVPSSQNGRVSASFSDDPDRSPIAVFQGAWAWFRLLDNTPTATEDGRRYVLTFDTGRDRAQIRIQDAFPSEPRLQRGPPAAVARDRAVPDWKQLLRPFRCT